MVSRSRFAPSPTGLLHVGNARSAILNWAYISNKKGEFILRIDDTDKLRSKKEFEDKIKQDLQWLGIKWHKTFNQSDRLNIYKDKIQKLKEKKIIYPCFETTEELSLKKKAQLTSGKPPIYDRSSLELSKEEIEKFINEGRKPHWRFKLKDSLIEWSDLIKGKVSFDSKYLSDPVLIREDETLLYHLPSVIDDIEEKITDIIRGEDHISNTAFHIQIFEALDAKIPNFGHHPFLTDSEGKGFGKRLGSLSLNKLRDGDFESITVLNYLLNIGTSNNLTTELNKDLLIESFNMKNISSSSPKFSIDILKSLNSDILKLFTFADVKDKFKKLENEYQNSQFWKFVKNNIDFFYECLEWQKVINNLSPFEDIDLPFLKNAYEVLPLEPYNEDSWDNWISLIKKKTGRKGKELFMPLRKALTGKSNGPELKFLLPLLTRQYIKKKFGIIA